MRIDLQCAVTGIALAARRLRYQEPFAVDSDVERVTALLHAARTHIVPDAAVLNEADGRILTVKAVLARRGLDVFLEQGAVRLEAVGIDVGDVVGNNIHLALKRDLSRQSDEKHILHR